MVHRQQHNEGHVRERLDSKRELVRRVRDEGVERVSKTSLTDKLECSPAHPRKHVDFYGALVTANAVLDAFLELGRME